MDIRKHNSRVMWIGIGACILCNAATWGMWTIVVMLFQIKWEFIAPGIFSGVLMFGIAWTICSAQKHSIGLDISEMDQDEALDWIHRFIRRIKAIDADKATPEMDKVIERYENFPEVSEARRRAGK